MAVLTHTSMRDDHGPRQPAADVCVPMPPIPVEYTAATSSPAAAPASCAAGRMTSCRRGRMVNRRSEPTFAPRRGHPPWDRPLRPHPRRRPDRRDDPLRQQRASLVRTSAIAPGLIRLAPTRMRVSITLIGPGGAGKSTVGPLIAKRLSTAFVDLDQRFATRAGDISRYIDRFGYSAYARENVETYDSLLHEGIGQFVAALSSGFMTYPRDIHPQYARLREHIEESPTTFVLVPSLNCDTCVAETVRRQLARPFARSAGKEEAVIRERFPIYVGLRARKIETMRPLTTVVDELVVAIWASEF